MLKNSNYFFHILKMFKLLKISYLIWNRNPIYIIRPKIGA